MTITIHSKTHEGAVIVSAEFSLTAELYAPDALPQRMRPAIETLRDYVETRGGIVGHIKGCAEKRSTVSMSCAGKEVDASVTEVSTVSLTAIAFNVGKVELQRFVKLTLLELVGSRQ